MRYVLCTLRGDRLPQTVLLGMPILRHQKRELKRGCFSVGRCLWFVQGHFRHVRHVRRLTLAAVVHATVLTSYIYSQCIIINFSV